MDSTASGSGIVEANDFILIEFLMSSFTAKSKIINLGKNEMASFGEVLQKSKKAVYCCWTYAQTSSFRTSLLTELTCLKSNKLVCERWHKAQLLAFKAVKAMIAREVLCTYPEPNEPFNIKTNASNYQLSTVIKQHGHPIAFFSHKLTGAQHEYTTMSLQHLAWLQVHETSPNAAQL
jgi:hypothetical protein